MAKSRGKDLAINTIIIGIGKFSTQIVSFLLLPLYTSILTTSEYGVYDLIATIAMFLMPAITLLMEESMFRFLIDCNTDEEKQKVISQTCLYIIKTTILFLGIILVLNLFIKIPYILVGILYLLCLIITGIRNAVVRGLGKIKLFTLTNFITSVLTIILNILFIAVIRLGVYGLLYSVIIANVVTSIFVFIKLKIHKFISVKSYDKELTKKMIRYSVPLVPNSLSWTIVNLSDRLVISGFLGAAANGIYSMAYKFPNLMDTIYNFFYTAWKESSSKAVKDDDRDEFFNKIYKMLSNVMFAVSVGIIACMPLMFNIFIKEAYNEAFLYIPILVIAMYYNNMSGYYGGIFAGYKDTKIMGTTTIVAAIINLVVNVALIKFIGIYAAALSTLVSSAMIYYYRKVKVKKYVELESSRNIIGILILVLTLILYYINDNVIIKLLNLLIVGIFALISNKDIFFKLKESLHKEQ